MISIAVLLKHKLTNSKMLKQFRAFWNLEFKPLEFGIFHTIVTPTKEVSRFIEFLSRDSS